jgi:putative transposase
MQVGVHRIKRLRKKLGLRCKQKRKFKVTTDSNHQLPVVPNLLARNFTASAPNQVWVADISYVSTAEGWLYLAGIKEPIVRRRLSAAPAAIRYARRHESQRQLLG